VLHYTLSDHLCLSITVMGLTYSGKDGPTVRRTQADTHKALQGPVAFFKAGHR